MRQPAESWLSDMDGVLIREEHAVPGAIEFLARLIERGKRFLVLTNNSTFTPRDLAARLALSGLEVPEESDPNAGISLTYQEFLDAVARLREVDFPIERDPAEAWADFVGWRVNYEQSAYAVAYAVDAVPAMWSGPRRCPDKVIPPIRPALGRPPK